MAKSFALVIQAFVAFKSYCTVIPCIAVIVEMLQDRFAPLSGPNQGFQLRTRRTVATLVVALLSFFAQNYLGAVEALVGGVCSMSTSLIFPVLFYYLLNRRAAHPDGGAVMSRCSRGLYVVITSLSMLAMMGIVASSVADVLHGDQDQPLPPSDG